MESKCITDKCKKEIKTLEIDKEYIALKERIDSTSKLMIALNLKPKLSKKDIDKVNTLYNKMVEYTNDKIKIESFIKMRMCTFDRCRKDMDDTIKNLMNECEEKSLSKKACKIIQTKIDDPKKFQKAIDAVFLDIWADWKKRMINKIT